MNLFERAVRSCFRKPVKSILLLLVVCIISLLFLSGMASRSANIAVNDSTRQAIGAGFLLEGNPEDRTRRLEEAGQKSQNYMKTERGVMREYIRTKLMSAVWKDGEYQRIIPLNRLN